jgi:hypothetical protein
MSCFVLGIGNKRQIRHSFCLQGADNQEEKTTIKEAFTFTCGQCYKGNTWKQNGGTPIQSKG